MSLSRTYSRRQILYLMAAFTMIGCKQKPSYVKERAISRMKIREHFSNSKTITVTIHESNVVANDDKSPYVEYARFNLSPAKTDELARIFDDNIAIQDIGDISLKMISPKHSIIFLDAGGIEIFQIDIDFEASLLMASDSNKEIVDFQYSNLLVRALRDFFNRNSLMHHP